MQIPQAILNAGAQRFGVNGTDIRYLGGGGPGAGGVVFTARFLRAVNGNLGTVTKSKLHFIQT